MAKDDDNDNDYKDYKYETNGDPSKCEFCGGNLTWCGVCNVWSRTCCESYGSCMCN